VLEATRFCPSVRAVVIVTSDKCYENKGLKRGYREDDPMGGYDPYSSSKGCAELVVSSYLRSFFNPADFKKHAKAIASVRAGNVIGGGDWAKDRLVPDCMRALSSNKKVAIRYPGAVRPWQHVLDPLHGYLLLAQRLLEKGPEFSGAWNFGTDTNNDKNVSYIVERLASLWGKDSLLQKAISKFPHEAHYLRLDCLKAKSRLGWRNYWGINKALDKTAQWYRNYYDKKAMTEQTIEQIADFTNCVRRKGQR
jgi:CDP-glucose 4,6-dehydratase